jgi:hypothetical protein
MTRIRIWLGAGAAALAVLAVLAGAAVLGRGPAEPAGAPPEAPSNGWRWESYGGVEVQVPASWTYGITDAPWCIDGPSSEGRQVDGQVGRPGPVRGIGCPGLVPADKRGQHVWLGPGDGGPVTQRLDGGWVRDVVERGGTRVDVQTRDPAIRTRILGSIREVDVDRNGCPSEHPIAAARMARPQPGVDWAAQVTGVSICRYDRDTFHASRRLEGAAAQRVLDLIEAAPPGRGPDEPGGLPHPRHAAPGGTVLRFDTADGVRELFVRYDFGQPYGFDNGSTERLLTRESLTFMSGPLVVYAGPGVTMNLLPRS